MSTYQTIECKCGNHYRTKEMFSNCPYCGKKNFTMAGGALMILLAGFIVLAIAIAVLMFAGAIILAYYARKNNLQNKWYYIGAIAIGVFGIYGCYELIQDRSNEVMGTLGIISNCIGIGLASISLYKLK